MDHLLHRRIRIESPAAAGARPTPARRTARAVQPFEELADRHETSPSAVAAARTGASPVEVPPEARRIARFVDECDVSATPALLIAVGCVLLALCLL